MEDLPVLQPLSIQRRRYLSFFLMGIFVLGLPLLYLYATGYRLSLDENGAFISTGGLYVAAKRTGAEIYIDNELVRETRTFRTAFYAQGLEPGTHRVHVQRDGYHTWVKELPVYAHLVTEAQAFNMPLVPQVRIISPWKDSEGRNVLTASSTLAASTTNGVVVSRSINTARLVEDTEYDTLLALFAEDVVDTSASFPARVSTQFESIFSTGTSTAGIATSTKTSGGVRLSVSGDDVIAAWVDNRATMPYYYCAEEFELMDEERADAPSEKGTNVALAAETSLEVIGPVQSVSEDVPCTPIITLDRKGEEVESFDFFPGSTDLVVLALESGIYLEEIDGRAWHNIQPLLLGTGLDVRVYNGGIYAYDGKLMYHIITE